MKSSSRDSSSQLGVFLFQLIVVCRGLIEHPLELVNDGRRASLGLLLGALGLLPQLGVAAQQVIEQPLAIGGIVRKSVGDAHNMKYTRSFMLFQCIFDDFIDFSALSRRRLESLALACRPQVDPREEHGQLRRLEFDAILGARLGHLASSCLQAFVPDRQPVAIEVEDLDPIPAAVEKEEEMAGQGVLPEASLNQPAEAIEALAQVGGPRAEKDSDGRGEHDHGVASLGGRPASAATMRHSHSGSGTVSRWTRTWCGNSISTPRPRTASVCRGEESRSSGTNRGGSGRRRKRPCRQPMLPGVECRGRDTFTRAERGDRQPTGLLTLMALPPGVGAIEIHDACHELAPELEKGDQLGRLTRRGKAGCGVRLRSWSSAEFAGDPKTAGTRVQGRAAELRIESPEPRRNPGPREVRGVEYGVHRAPTVLLQPEMEKRNVRVIVELGRSFSDAKAPQELHAP